MYFFIIPFLLLIIIPLLLLFYLVPLSYAFQSLVTLFTLPREVYNLVKRPLIRKNHALEHATINLLEKQLQIKGLFSGFAREDGFIIAGPVDATTLDLAARMALEKLKAGDRDLAIHTSCGTGRAVASFISGLIILSIFIFTGYLNIWTLLLSFILSTLISPYTGSFAQKYLTTKPEVSDLVIREVQKYIPTEKYWISSNFVTRNNKFFVRTSRYLEILP